MTDEKEPQLSGSHELSAGAFDPTLSRGVPALELHPLARLPEEWAVVLSSLGEKPYRVKQILKWIYERGELRTEKMTDIPAQLRERLAALGGFEPGQAARVYESIDGTRKVLIEFLHGTKVETVLIPMTPAALDADVDPDPDPDDEPEPDSPKKRITLCISTQFGCAMGCRFCASGKSGLFRGLGAAEVVYQVLLARRYLKPDEEIRNLVFMGMGEPLHHYDETLRALRILTHPEARGMSPRRITVSTVGLVPGIERLGRDFGGKIGLAVSLHAPSDAVRSAIMPMNQRYPIADLMRALRAYPLPPRRRITIEYTLMDGINDSTSHADELCKLLAPLRVKVNLIPMNPVEKSEFSPPKPERVLAFRERLARHGLSTFIRTRRGDDVAAACGQLALQTIDPKRLTRRTERDP